MPRALTSDRVIVAAFRRYSVVRVSPELGAAGRLTLEQRFVAYEVGELEVIDKTAAEGTFPRWLRDSLGRAEHSPKAKRLSETESEQAAASGAPPR